MTDIDRSKLLLLKENLEKKEKQYNQILLLLVSIFDKKDYSVDECKILSLYFPELALNYI